MPMHPRRVPSWLAVPEDGCAEQRREGGIGRCTWRRGPSELLSQGTLCLTSSSCCSSRRGLALEAWRPDYTSSSSLQVIIMTPKVIDEEVKPQQLTPAQGQAADSWVRAQLPPPQCPSVFSRPRCRLFQDHTASW